MSQCCPCLPCLHFLLRVLNLPDTLGHSLHGKLTGEWCLTQRRHLTGLYYLKKKQAK